MNTPGGDHAEGSEEFEEFEYTMPSLGADMDEGTVVDWNVTVGDEVHRGDVVARVETEKSDIDIEIWRSGIVEEVLVPVHRLVSVGTPLLRVRATDRAVPGHEAAATPETPEPMEVSDTLAEAPTTGTASPVPAPLLPPEPVVVPRTDQVGAGGDEETVTVWATPLARRLAGEHGIVLTEVSGSGPGGAIRRRDVLAHAEAVAKSAPPTDAATETGTGAAAAAADRAAPRDRTARMRAAIAVRMTRSSREIPHYHLAYDVDLGPLTEHLAALNLDLPIGHRIVPAAAFVRATALAAARHGALNGHWIDDAFVDGVGVNLAVAISLRGGGLVTPQIRHADRVTLVETMAMLRKLTAGARSGVLRSESTGEASTITVTNLGDRGADVVNGLISPPEVALVGFGRVSERAWVVDGTVVARPVVTVSLAADHRATDGATGSRFLATLARLLEHPEEL